MNENIEKEIEQLRTELNTKDNIIKDLLKEIERLNNIINELKENNK